MPHSASPTRVLIYVEDPGAANFIVPLVSDSIARDTTYKVLAQGRACRYLIERRVEFAAVPDNANALDVIRSWPPDLVAIGTCENTRTWAWQLLDATRTLQLPALGFVDSCVNAAFRFRGETHDPLRYLPDALIVPDDATREAFVKLGVGKEAIHVCGHPNHDRVTALTERLHQSPANVGADRHQDELKIVFLSELSSAIGGGVYQRDSSYTLTGTRGSHLRTHVVLDEFLQACGQVLPKARRVLRLHPKQDVNDLSEYLAHFQDVSSGGDPIEAVQDADLVVGMTTALLDEAVLLGKPTLAIVPREVEQYWNASVQWGATVAVWQRKELLAQLVAFRDRRELKRRKTCQLPESGAVQRVTKVFSQLSQRSGRCSTNPDANENCSSVGAGDHARPLSMPNEFNAQDWRRRRQAC